jgi:hypothetical protein
MYKGHNIGDEIIGHIKKYKLEYFLAIVTVLLFILFTPVNDEGDSEDYIQYAERFLGMNDISFPFRSPLYPLVLAFFIKIFGTSELPGLVLGFQLALVFSSAILVKKMFSLFELGEKQINAIVLLSYFNFSLLYYSCLYVTEVLTFFLLTFAVYRIYYAIISGKIKDYAVAGFLTGLMILVRYNLIPLLPVLFGLIALKIIIEGFTDKKKMFTGLITKTASFVVPLLIVLSVWSVFNYEINGNFGLFPGAGISKSEGGTGVPFYVGRNALVATIKSSLKISEENQKVFKIFLESKDKIIKRDKVSASSWMNILGKEQKEALANAFIGYKVYRESLVPLYSLFNLKDEDEGVLNGKLNDFYKEVYSQTWKEVNIVRGVSLVYTLWVASSLRNEPGKGAINFNGFPDFFITLHKVYWLLMMYLFVVVSTWLLFRNRKLLTSNKEYLLFSTIIIIDTILLTNIVFNTINDASRFKFPIESMVIGVVVISLPLIKLPFRKKKLLIVK